MSISSKRIKPNKRLKKAPGPGKTAKVFSENLGLSHLLSLVEDISSRKDSEDEEKIQRSKLWQEKKKEAARLKKLQSKGVDPDDDDDQVKVKEKMRRKGSKPEPFQLDSSGRPAVGSNSISNNSNSNSGSVTETGSVHSVAANTKATSRTEIKSRLKAQMRQKSKERKERRKGIRKVSRANSDPDSPSPESQKDSISSIISRLISGVESEGQRTTAGKEANAPPSQDKAKAQVGIKRKRSDSSVDQVKDKVETQAITRNDPISVLKTGKGGEKTKEGSEAESRQKGKGKPTKKKRVSFA